ncbi:MAG: sugar ABC transporter substrate-binding protein, partial [Solirubrobacterales bacterium]|nr:sugar ABC transporter substrate-binding protein [Solirubrobacterales bacterium]
MLKRILAVLAILAAAVLVACGSDDEGGGGAASEGGGEEKAKGKIGVILPDTASSKRWEEADRKFLGEAFEAAGVEYDIQNANGDKAKFATIADQMINGGVTVLLL